jgi:hypothetical protein
MVIARLTHTFPGRSNEWFCATFMFLWGIVLLQPAATLAESPGLYPLLRITTEANWTALCLIIGLLRLVILFINGSWRASPKWRAAFAFFGCFFWFQVSLGVATSGIVSTALACYPLVFLMDVYSTFRAGLDARTVAEDREADRSIMSGAA